MANNNLMFKMCPSCGQATAYGLAKCRRCKHEFEIVTKRTVNVVDKMPRPKMDTAKIEGGENFIESTVKFVKQKAGLN